MKKSLIKALIGILCMFGVGLATSPGAAVASPGTMSASIETTPNLGPAPTWVPWDGNKITTAGNCKWWRGQIHKLYEIPLSRLRCTKFYTNTCPSTAYWMLMVLTSPGSAPEARREVMWVPQSEPLC